MTTTNTGMTSTATTVTSGMVGGPAVVPPSPMVPPFSEAHLLAFSAEHVAYEVQMFFSLVETLGKVLAAPDALKLFGDPDHITYALMESFVIHFRNLHAFLFDGKKTHKTDVLAIDFFASATDWENVRPARSAVLDTARDRANTELAHLTCSRKYGSPPDKAWEFGVLASKLRPVLTAFVHNALKARLSPTVRASIP